MIPKECKRLAEVDFPIARVLSSKNGAKVRESVKFESSMKSNGAFVAPTGSF